MINRKLLIALAAASAVGFSLPTFAQWGCSGVYIGGGLGWGQVDHKHHHNHWSESVSETRFDRHHRNNDNDGLAGRAYLGYQFNQYVALETGFAGFSTNDKSHGHDHDRQAHHHHNHDDGWRVNTTQWDLLARLGAPFGESCFRGDIKLGAAGVFVDNDHGDRHHIHDRQDHHHHHGHDNSEWGPAAGASLTYNFNKCVAMDLSYLHVFGDFDHHDHHDNDHNSGSNTDLVTIGVSYLFIM